MLFIIISKTPYKLLAQKVDLNEIKSTWIKKVLIIS